MPIETNLEDQLNKFKEQYYQENKKKTFFKTSQKKDCAEKVVQHFSIEQLLQNSVYINKNTIFIDYPIIKTFIQPNNYYLVMDYIDKIHDYMFTNNETINIVIDMKSFTITAAQRYMELIKQFCNPKSPWISLSKLKFFLTNKRRLLIFFEKYKLIISLISSIYSFVQIVSGLKTKKF